MRLGIHRGVTFFTLTVLTELTLVTKAIIKTNDSSTVMSSPMKTLLH